MSGNSTEGHDHGMRKVQCPVCNGCGEVVKPVMVWNHQTKQNDLIQRAIQCPICGGEKEVWI